MSITALLLDADGVLQRDSRSFEECIGKLTPRSDKSAFLSAILEAEDRCLTGEQDFAETLIEVMREWDCCAPPESLLAALHCIEVDHTVLEVVSTLRERGVQCCLATNQQPYRAAYMLDSLNYGSVFDRQFYSCHMGVAKPDHAYFEYILAAIEVRPCDVLFVDDRAQNVDAAAALGLNAQLFSANAGGNELRKLIGKYGIQA